MSDIVSNDIAAHILRKEIQLETVLGNPKKSQKEKLEKINSLVETYTQSIEYYQAKESDLYIDLNLRMQQLLIRPDILDILDKEVEILAQANNESKSSSDNSGLFNDNIIDIDRFEPGRQRLTMSDKRIFQNLDKDACMRFDPYAEMNFDNENRDQSNHNYNQSGHDSKIDTKGVTKKNKVRFDTQTDFLDEFVHKNDRRNRHGVSFKVWKNKEDGALVRPKLYPRTGDKLDVYDRMLNENNNKINSHCVASVTKQVMDDYNNPKGKLSNLFIYLL